MGLKDVVIHTDGACVGNPGPGGYGVLLQFGRSQKEFEGGYRRTTNNRMELKAAIVGLQALKEPCRVTLHSDSRSVVDAMTQGWALKWRAKGWKRSKKERAVNPDLWEELLLLCEHHEVEFHWVKGHAGNRENERCDELAERAARRPNLPVDEGYETGGQAPLGPLWADPEDFGESPPEPLVQQIRRGLDSSDAGRRRDSIFRAVEDQVTELGPDLLVLMEHEPELDLKGRCAWALGKLNYREAPHPYRQSHAPVPGTTEVVGLGAW